MNENSSNREDLELELGLDIDDMIFEECGVVSSDR